MAPRKTDCWERGYLEDGFLREYYYYFNNKGQKIIYCNQWDFGYDKVPVFYRCSRDGEPDYPVKRPYDIPAVRIDGGDKLAIKIDKFIRDWLSGENGFDPDPAYEGEWWFSALVVEKDENDDIHAVRTTNDRDEPVWEVKFYLEHEDETDQKNGLFVGQYKAGEWKEAENVGQH
jgi:hypothetical protein